jgi:hypothetical protein
MRDGLSKFWRHRQSESAAAERPRSALFALRRVRLLRDKFRNPILRFIPGPKFEILKPDMACLDLTTDAKQPALDRRSFIIAARTTALRAEFHL